MNFNTIYHEPHVQVYQELGMKNAIQLGKGPHLFVINRKNLSYQANLLLDFALVNDTRILNVFIKSKMFVHPKVFKPSQMDFELLEQMTLNIEFQDYAQPFETMTIELPDNYVKNKKIDLYNGENVDWPKLVTIHKDEQGFVSLSTRDSGNSIISASLFQPEGIIEHNLEGATQNESSVQREIVPREIEIEKQILRASLNFCLLVDEVGAKKIGPHNQKHYDKLKIRGQSVQNIPIYFELNQHAPLFKVVNSVNELGEPTGRHVCPHHRRGHYRMQPYKDCRKRIRIPAVFVNGHYFLGNNTNYVAE